MQFTASAQRLKQLQDRLAPFFPTPQETAVRFPVELITDLLSEINALKSAAETVQWARHLLPSRLNLLFPALAISEQRRELFEPKTLEKLFLVIRERACASLYPKAWAIWQQYYFQPQVNRGLIILCGILEIKRSSGITPPKSSQSLVSGQKSARSLLPLITNLVELNTTNTARKLISKLINYPLSLADFLENYDVDSQAPFGQAVLYYALSAGSASMFVNQIDWLDHLFKEADPAARLSLMRHFLVLTDLPEAVRQQAHVAIYSAVGAPGGPDPIWNELSDREKRSFSVWAGRSRIGAHCLSRPAVAQFYLRYADHIQRVEQWDAQTVLIHFKTFVIADDIRFPDQALFYAGTSPSRHPGGLADADRDISPGNPSVTHKQVGEVLRAGEIFGIIQLHLDPEGLKEAGVLLDFALQSRSKGGLFQKNWLK